MKGGFLNILRGKFLTDENAAKNWVFILYLTLLALIMIRSSHSAEKKVHDNAQLAQQVKELRSKMVDIRTRVTALKMETKLAREMAERGIYSSTVPPVQLEFEQE